MDINGVVISVNLSQSIKKAAGGTYEGWELVYRTDDNQVKTVAKPVQGLKFNPALAEGLRGLKPGDPFVMVMEKNGQYWEVKEVSKGSPKPAEPSSHVAAPASTASTGRASTYETAEERAKKQVFIIRQSSLSNALAYFALGKKAVSLDEVLDVATALEEYVLNGRDAPAAPFSTNDFDGMQAEDFH
jgi:hypothetical protein